MGGGGNGERETMNIEEIKRHFGVDTSPSPFLKKKNMCSDGESFHNFKENTRTGRIFCTKCGEMKGPSCVPEFFQGMIAMWHGSIDSIPNGWVLCNGKQGTPDLRDKFLVGASNDKTSIFQPGSTGGVLEQTLTLDHIPEHVHDRNDDGLSEAPICEMKLAPGDKSDSQVKFNKVNYNYDPNRVIYDASMVRKTTGPSGSKAPQPLDNCPPYYALCFIMCKPEG